MLAPVSEKQDSLVTATDQGLSGEEVYVFPASFGQRRLWFLDQFEPGSPYYNIPSVFRLTGHFSLSVFDRAIQEIVRRHESLRTTFSGVNGQPVQVVSPRYSPEIRFTDLSQHPQKDRENELMRMAREEARSPFDLAKGPLFRTGVVRMDEFDHVILISMHHIISDGWSIGILLREITTLYAAFQKGLPSPLPELPIQYPDFAQWQRDWFQGEVFERQLSYWKKQLEGSPELLELPTDRPRPSVYTNVGASESMHLSKEVASALNTLCRQEGVTMFMTLLAAFQVLLSRCSGQDEICVGTPIANRTQAELEGLIGLFINTLVLRTDLSGEPTFTELLKRVREVTLGAYGHQDLPFEMLLDALHLDRDMSHTPLFQVMFILQNTPSEVQVLPGVQLTQIDVDMGTATFDMTLSIAESADGVRIDCEYNTDLFEAATVIRLLKHYRHVLESIAKNPRQHIVQIPILSEEEASQILYAWNDNTVDIPEKCVHQLIEDQASRTPEAPAVVSGSHRLSYGELDSRANKLARYLMRTGIRPEVRVGICLEKSLEMIVAVLGVLKSGGAYVPLDPAQPEERLAFMFEDSQSKVLLTQRALRDALPPFAGPVICLDDEWAQVETEHGDNPNVSLSPDNLAYMIYTSGTTGKSKGTMVSHRSLVNAYLGWEDAYALRTIARSHLQMANFAFDVFSGDFVRALCSGGKLVLCPRETLLDAPRLYNLMVSESVAIAEFVPAVLRNLIQYLDETDQNLGFMRLLIAGSDIWYVGEYKKFLTYISRSTRLINSFGLTEATIDSSYFEAADLDLPVERLVPIGRPFPNSQIFILDRVLQPTPIGVTGEVYIGGLGLAQGYHGRPDLTAEKFVPNPFCDDGGKRLYKTGDLARFLPDGNIEFLGRMDHQVKIRGFRVELGEIETALTKNPSVKEGVVLVREDAAGSKNLVAYVVPTPGHELSIGELRTFLLEKVPDYMVPSAFVVLDTLPLTPNGKVDRKALPAPDQSSLELGGEYVPPRNSTEQVMATIWKEILGVERVGVHDNFFLLGGHSLLATQLVSRVRGACHVELPLRKIFETPTVAALAEAIDSAQVRHEEVHAPPMKAAARTEEMPLSFAQQRLWFLDQLEPNSPFYNLPEVYRVRGALSIPILERSFNEVVRRHENLRSSIVTVEGRPIQKFAPRLNISLPLVDLSDLLKEEQEAEILLRAAEEAQQPIPLDRAPLFRAKLLRLDNEQHVIVLIMHHIISDDWSTGILLREVAVLYDAFARNLPSPLPELPLQYADFAVWQKNWLRGDVLEEQVSYWKRQLGGVPPVLELPTDRPRPPVQTFRGTYKTFELSKELSLAVRELCDSEGVTLFMALLAAFSVLLRRYSRQNDISIGTPIANRNRAEVEGLIGFFVNTLVMRFDLSGRATFREVLKRVRDVALGAYAHQDIPFETVVEALKPVRDLSHTPLFQVMFVLQNSAAQKQQVDMPDLSIGPVEAHSGTAKFDLTLFMHEGEDGLGGAFEYNTDLFDASTIDRMVSHFRALLEGVVAHPDQPVITLPVLSEAENRKLLAEWNDTVAEYQSTKSIHGLFEDQVRRTPNALALTQNQDHLTYLELNGRANQLAHRLRTQGVGPDKLVAICMERSQEMVVAILGTLKAGGAYVPLDPSYPLERLTFMLEDSGASILLTQQRLLEKLAAWPGRTIPVDAAWQDIASENDQDLTDLVAPENLAYVIYTSGSTGKPKGVMVHHGGVVNYLTWCQRSYPLSVGRGAAFHSSISFDLTVTSIFAPLASGRAVQLIPEDVGVESLVEALRTEGNFSLLKITPAHLDLLSKQLLPLEARDRTHSFIIGGENLLAETIAFWQDFAPETLLVNEYGPTETVVGCCVYKVPKGERRLGSVPIGRPIINTRLYIVDEEMQCAPVGVAGELYIGGAGVARGYLNRVELTAEKFVPDPFSAKPGERLYRTGDECRYLADGNIEYLGRADEQVKIRGYRVELGEIKAVLTAHPSVREAVAVVRDDEPGDRRLVAYVVPHPGQSITVGELRSFLQARVPEYMIPALFVFLEALPLTPNGKVDRRALPEPGKVRQSPAAEYVAPTTPIEETLARIWTETLGVDRVGTRDNFFELGGDSILTIQIVARAHQAGIHLTAKMIFQHPTIEALACVADAGHEVNAEQGEITGPVPLTPIQHWFFGQGLPNPHHWNQSLLLEVDEPLDVVVLEDAVRHLLRHHDALRMRFVHGDFGWDAHNAGTDDVVNLTRVDLSEVPDENLAAAVEAASAELQASLDIAKGPLLRMAYFDRGPGRSGRLLIVIHHLVIDGVSWRILIEDFQTLYHQLRQNGAVQLPRKSTSYQHWARRLTEYAQSEELSKEADYWLGRVDSHNGAIPVDFPGGENTERSSASVTMALGVEETRALLHDVPGLQRTEINDVLLAALALTVAHWTGSSHVLVDLEGHGREEVFGDVDLSRTIGWFTTIVPVLLDCSKAQEPLAALKSVKDELRRIPNRGIGYGVLKYLSDNPETSKSLRSVKPSAVAFNYLGQMDQTGYGLATLRLAREGRGLERNPDGLRTHILEIEGAVLGGQLQLEWTFSENIHRRPTIEKISRSFVESLKLLIELSLSGEGERFSPPDFAEFGWNEDDLNGILSEIQRSTGQDSHD